MKNSQYLYGDQFDSKAMAEMPYATALAYKNHCAKLTTDKLIKEPMLYTDWRRINTIAKAMRFNELLLKEAKGED